MTEPNPVLRLTTTRQRKIVHMTSVHRPFDVRIFEKQCRSLAKHGDEVVLIAVHDQDEVRDGVQVRAIPKANNQLARMLLTTTRVVREALRQRADLYQIHDPELLVWTPLLRLLGKCVVYDMHENVPKDICTKTWIPRWMKGMLSALIRVVERVLMFRLPVIFAESSYARDYAWVKPSVLVLNLPDLDLLPSPEPAEKSTDITSAQRLRPRVAYIGGVAVDRGSRVTLQALARLRQRGLDVGWECVGPIWPPAHEAELRREVEQAGLEGVHFHGYCSATEGWAKIRSCQVGLAVLLPVPNMVDSYPTKMFEYMAMQMPVVVSDFPLYRDVVVRHQCGHVVNPESADELADAIEAIVRDPEAAAEMGRRGREAVLAEYNWESEFGKLLDFYEQLRSPRRTSGLR